MPLTLVGSLHDRLDDWRYIYRTDPVPRVEGSGDRRPNQNTSAANGSRQLPAREAVNAGESIDTLKGFYVPEELRGLIFDAKA